MRDLRQDLTGSATVALLTLAVAKEECGLDVAGRYVLTKTQQVFETCPLFC